MVFIGDKDGMICFRSVTNLYCFMYYNKNTKFNYNISYNFNYIIHLDIVIDP